MRRVDFTHFKVLAVPLSTGDQIQCTPTFVTVHGKTSLMGQKIDFEILCLLDSPESAISKNVYKIKIREVYPEILTI